MAKQAIGIGSSANDGTGDPLRTAFDKINDNFTELYGTTMTERVVLDLTPQLGGDLDVNGNDLVSTSAGNIALVPDGAGVVQAKDSGGTTAAVKIAGKETMWVPATAMYASTTNGAEAAQA